ncbi:MAG: GYD domain-containing protein [Acidimicrobiia bacterium]|nr:GYD domain-containing protein [Acidimicrobiia bacterium]
MPQYAVLAKYSSAALGAIREAGYTSRVEQMKALCESVGGQLINVGFCGSGIWDFVGFVDVPSDGVFTALSLAGSTGAFERVEYHELRSAEQMDALRTLPTSWQAPGS